MGEVDRHVQLLLQFDGASELPAVVHREAAPFRGREFSEGLLEPFRDGLGGTGFDLSGDQVVAGPTGTGGIPAGFLPAHEGHSRYPRSSPFISGFLPRGSRASWGRPGKILCQVFVSPGGTRV